MGAFAVSGGVIVSNSYMCALRTMASQEMPKNDERDRDDDRPTDELAARRAWGKTGYGI